MNTQLNLPKWSKNPDATLSECCEYWEKFTINGSAPVQCAEPCKATNAKKKDATQQSIGNRESPKAQM